MEYNDVVRDFANRTLRNLETIEAIAAEQKAKSHPVQVFEVTQLVNSMLGLIVFPREEYVDQIPQTHVDELVRTGWPIPRAIGQVSRPPEDLRSLIKFMRNSIAHFNVEFLIDPETLDISSVKLWNLDCEKNKTWEAVIPVDELRLLAVKFAQLMTDHSIKT